MPRRIFGGRARAKNRHVRRALRAREACSVRTLGWALLATAFLLVGAWAFTKFSLPPMGGSLENTLNERRQRHRLNLNLRKHQVHTHHRHAQRTGLEGVHLVGPGTGDSTAVQ
jgi:hypothetical protein